MLTPLSQRDPRWAAINLGNSHLTLGRFGCTTTCLSMLTSYFGGFIYPDAIAKLPSNYTSDGLIVWTKLNFKKMKFGWREYGENKEMILKSLNDPNGAVILQVNNRAHWVVALRKTIFGDDYVCLDPWTGKKCTAKGTYHNINGSAHFTRI